METKELFERFLEVIDALVIEGHKIKIASIETLYKLKEKTYRVIDQNDLAFLKELIKRKKK